MDNLEEFEQILESMQVEVDGYEDFDSFLEDTTEPVVSSEVGVSWDEETFYTRIEGIENIMMVQLAGIALIAAAVIANLIMRFFHVR